MLNFPFHAQSDLVHELIVAFVLHLLYARAILPEPFEGLKRELTLSSPEATETLKYADRKKLKSISEIDEALQCFRSVVSSCSVQEVAVLFGPSANNPKDTYTMRFTPNQSQSSESAGMSPLLSKQINTAKRQLIHKLIEHQSDEECAPALKSNVFFAMKLDDGSLDHENIDIMLDDVLQKFSFRDTFKLRCKEADNGSVAAKRAFGGRRRTKPFHLAVVSKGEVYNSDTLGSLECDRATTATASQDAAFVGVQCVSGSGDGTGRWLVLNKGIKTVLA